jgi:hypothetical protein
MRKRFFAGGARLCSSLAVALFTILGPSAFAQSAADDANALLAIDQQRASVVERIVETWGPTLAKPAHSSRSTICVRG